HALEGHHARRDLSHRHHHRARRRAVLPQPDHVRPPGDLEMSLEICGLTFGYRNHKLFDGLDTAPLKRGELTALVGPNGVGKSSLFRIVAGLLSPAGGTTRLDGDDAAAMTGGRRAEGICLLTQHTSMNAALGVFGVIL